MGLFTDLAQDDAVVVEEEKLGGGGQYVNETGVYDFVIKMAFGGQSSGGAYFIDMKLETEDGKKMSYRNYLTSGTSKGTRPYYVDRNGKQQALPGYSQLNAVDILLTGSTAQYPQTESKKIPLWNKEAGKEVLTEVEVVTGWVGKPITALVRAVQEFKRADNGSGKWVDTDETKITTEVVHFVDAVTGQTRSEKMAGKDAALKGQFEAKYDSAYVLDRTKGKGKPAGKAAEAEAPADSPFGATKA